MFKKVFALGFLIVVSALFCKEKHTLFTEILQKYVRNGAVNYSDMKKDERLDRYINYLSETDPEKFETKNEKLAFYINAYNAYTLKIICKNYPVESINDLHFGGLILGTVLKSTVWDQDSVIINHNNISLNYLEHEIIRPVFKEPRIHFALVCAAKSCPILRSEAYEGEKLDSQLEDQADKFFRNQKKNRFDKVKKIAFLSKILDWYDSDFGGSDSALLKFAAQYLPEDIKKSILNDPSAWEISFLEYDWSLNE